VLCKLVPKYKGINISNHKGNILTNINEYNILISIYWSTEEIAQLVYKLTHVKDIY